STTRPRRTRLRPAHRPMARPETHHRQPQQNRRLRPGSSRTHPLRTPPPHRFLLRSPHCVAAGADPSATTAGQLARGTAVRVDAGADEQEVVRLLSEHKIRRLPVIENRRLIGMISEADVATHLPEEEVAEFARAIYSAPPTS